MWPRRQEEWYRRPAQTRSQLTSHDRLHSGLPRSVFPRLPGSGRYSHTRSVQEGELLFSSGWWLQLAIHVWCLIIFEKKCSWELGKRKALGRRKVCTWKWYFLFSSTQYIKQNTKYKIQNVKKIRTCKWKWYFLPSSGSIYMTDCQGPSAPNTKMKHKLSMKPVSGQ